MGEECQKLRDVIFKDHFILTLYFELTIKYLAENGLECLFQIFEFPPWNTMSCKDYVWPPYGQTHQTILMGNASKS